MNSLIQKFKKLLFYNRCSMCKGRIQDEHIYICKECRQYLKDNSNIKRNGNYYYIYHYNVKIKALLTDYKLKKRRGIGKEIGILIGNQLQKIIKKENIDVVIPVPISNSRLKERGFNQVEEILKFADVEYFKIKRVKDTQYMYRLKNEKEREMNVRKAFKIEGNLTNKNILIVDDILTTGATLKEIVREIKENNKVGDIKIFILGVAKSYLKRGGIWH